MNNLILFNWFFSHSCGRVTSIRFLKHVVIQEDLFFKLLEDLQWMLAPSILKFFSLFIHSLSWELLSFLMIYLFGIIKKVANLTLRYLVPSDFHDIPGWAIWFMHISFSGSLVISAVHFTKNQRPRRDSWTLDSTFCLCIHLSLTVKRIERPLMWRNFLW